MRSGHQRASVRFACRGSFLLLCGSLACTIAAGPPTKVGQKPIAQAALTRSNLDDFLKAPDGILKLEGEILASRLAIKSAEFEIEDIRDSAGGQHVFNTHHWLGPEGCYRQVADNGRSSSTVINDGEFAYSYSESPAMMGPGMRIGVTQMSADEARGQTHFLAHNPLGIMLSPGLLLPNYPADIAPVFEPAEQENLEARTSRWDDEPSIIVSFTYKKTGVVCECEVVPTRSFNIIRWRLSGTSPSTGTTRTPFVVTRTCQLASVGQGVWFPKNVTESSTYGNRQRTETLTIKTISVNQPIDPKIFTLAGGTLRAGSLVITHHPSETGKGTVHPSSEPILVWDGKIIRPLTKEDDAEYQRARNRARDAKAR